MSTSVLKWESLRLDCNSCQATYKNQPLHLTPLQYALLELFLQNTQRVFSLSELLENLWSMRKMPRQDAVRSHIKGLRQKLKTAGAPADLIETVYGLGYRLRAQKTFSTSSETHGNASCIATFASVAKQSDDRDSARTDDEQKNSLIEQLSLSPLHLSRSTFEPVCLCVPRCLLPVSAHVLTPIFSLQPVQALPVSERHQTPTQLQIQAAMASVWQRFKDKIVARAIVLEQAIAAVREGQLVEDLRSEAEWEAHKLAGSLGTFGFASGSCLAKEIEQIFKSGVFLGEAEAIRLGELLAALQIELLGTEKQPETGEDGGKKYLNS